CPPRRQRQLRRGRPSPGWPIGTARPLLLVKSSLRADRNGPGASAGGRTVYGPQRSSAEGRFMRSCRLIISIFLVVSPAAVGAGPLRTNELTIAGGYSESEGLSASGMSLWLRRGQPGVAFGVAKGPVTAPHYAYVLLITGDPRRQALAG